MITAGRENRDSAKLCKGCGKPLVRALEPGADLDRGRYEVLKPLKTGGMGAIYLLWDNRLERECVLKEMQPPLYPWLPSGGQAGRQQRLR